MFEPEKYTVGWICAIEEEYVAAQVFLDEIHGKPDSVALSSTSHCTLGQLGQHYVVVAVLPNGEYGTISAATIAQDLLHHFPGIRIGLMVGIGGGAPSKYHDIRLGDIVVSTPCHGTGGVIQLDYGKEIQNQQFLPTSHLNKPPTVLLTAVHGLKTKYTIDGHHIEGAIASVLNKKPRLKKAFGRPDVATDRLYKSSFVHPPGFKGSCAEVCQHDSSAIVPRPPRAEDDDNPMIHYGLIASSNRLIKDASVRDRLAAEKDILCFEMEAAGLMDNFPCLVIRGISDYSDSHKNKEWRGYAALAAAAYAKALLAEISPPRVLAERKLVDIVLGVQDVVNGMSQDLDSLLRAQKDQECQSVLEWLAAAEYSTQQNHHLEKRQKGSCEWLLRSKEFQHWLVQRGRILFCHGIPGAGKTVAASIIVDYLAHSVGTNANTGIAFIFFDHQQPLSQYRDLYASLLRQLIRPPIPEALAKLYASHLKHKTRPSSEEILNVLSLAISGYAKVFIVIDALDECAVCDGTRLKIIMELFNLQQKTNANLFATSRNIPEVSEVFKTKGSDIIEIRAKDEDVLKYVENEIITFPPWVRETPGMKREIVTRVVKAIEGKFLLAKLHLQNLRTKTSLQQIDVALDNLPRGSNAYYGAYDNIMSRIREQPKESTELAIRALSWITRSQRLLRPSELQHALAVTENSLEFPTRNLPDIRLILDVCSGLVTLDEKNDLVRLDHYTAREYFEECWASQLPIADRYLATISLTYLTYEKPFARVAQGWGDYRVRLKQNCLYEYVAHHWGYHVKRVYPDVKDLVANFLRSNSLASAAQALLVEQIPFGIFPVPEGISGLHLAAHFGITEEVSAFLYDTTCLKLTDGTGKTALHWAVKNGQVETVQLLLDQGVDVNAIDAEMKCALHYAASQGNRILIQLLMRYGAEMEFQDINQQTPLLIAASNAEIEAVEELLVCGANVDALDSQYRNVLHLAILARASRAARVSAMNLLLSHSVNFYSCDVGNMTPLHYAVGRGITEVIDLLLHAGADINRGIVRKRARATETKRPLHKECRELNSSKDENAMGLTALHFAACIGHSAMTNYLLAKGANPSVRCVNGDTPLHIALRRNILERPPRQHKPGQFPLPDYDEWTDDRWRVELSTDYISDYEGEEAVKAYKYVEEERQAVVNALLANPMIDVNIKNIELDSPLHVLRYDDCGADTIFHKLLELGADISACNKKGQTPLHLACELGSSAIVQEFMVHGACSRHADLQGLNAFHYAVHRNNADTLRILLGRSNEAARYLCREADTHGRTLLHHHLQSMNCCTDMMMVLISHGARLDHLDTEGNSPLSLYLQQFHVTDRTDICHLLLQHGSDAKWTHQNGQTLAHLAMSHWRVEVEVLQTLFAYGVEMAARDKTGKNILHHGAIHGAFGKGKESLSFILENKLVPFNDRDDQGKSPVEYALEEAGKKRSSDTFARGRWKQTLKYLQEFHSGIITRSLDQGGDVEMSNSGES